MLSDLEMHKVKQDVLSQDISRFLASGGAIQELPSFEFKPFPQRKPEPERKRVLDKEDGRIARIAEARKLSRTMTVGDAATFMKVGLRQMEDYAKVGGFSFMRAELTQQEKDIEQLVCMLNADGHSQRFVLDHARIGHVKCKKISEKHGLKWKK